MPERCCNTLSDRQKTNIVFVSGFDSAGHDWDIFENALQPWGKRVIQADLDVKLANMELTDNLYQWLREQQLLKAPLSLVCFSNGGLIARALLHKYGVMNVKRIIMIGTPNWGTTLAVYGRWVNNHPGLKDLAVGSDFLTWLNTEYTALKAVPHYVITGAAALDRGKVHHDGLVWEDSATLGYTLPYIKVKTDEPMRIFPLNSAWHLNLTRASRWYLGPSNDKAWPITLEYTRCLLMR